MRVLNVAIVVFIAITLSACGHDSPVGPTPSPTTLMVTGHVVSNPGGSMISGASVSFDGSAPVQTDPSGKFSAEVIGMNHRIKVSAPGFLEHQTGINGQDVTVDLISLSSPFSLTFYEQMVRNGLENPNLQPIRRYTSSPNFYIKTTDENGANVPQAEIDALGPIIRHVIPQLTGGRFQAGTVEMGPGPNPSESIAIEFVTTFSDSRCGEASSILIRFKYGSASCSPPCIMSSNVAPRTVAHELGHVMGFSHHSEFGIMGPAGCSTARSIDFSASEQFHAGIAYSRPNGNVAPDNDPTNFTLSIAGGDGGFVDRQLVAIKD